MAGYRDVAADVRAAIIRGDYPPGETIPTEAELSARYQVNRTTARRAIALLRAEGLVAPIRRRGTVVRDRTPVRVPFSRYAAVLSPPGDLGPWQTACADQGIEGRVDVIAVEQLPADANIATRLAVPEGTMVVSRLRHMSTGRQVAQIQQAWMPLAVVEGTPLASAARVEGGIYRALSALGRAPTTVTEEVSARMPTPEEADTMSLDLGSPVLVLDRVTRAADRAVLEALHVVAVADRVKLAYEDLPLT